MLKRHWLGQRKQGANCDSMCFDIDPGDRDDSRRNSSNQLASRHNTAQNGGRGKGREGMTRAGETAEQDWKDQTTMPEVTRGIQPHEACHGHTTPDSIQKRKPCARSVASMRAGGLPSWGSYLTQRPLPRHLRLVASARVASAPRAPRLTTP